MTTDDARTAMEAWLDGQCEHQAQFIATRGVHFGDGEWVLNECCLADLFASLREAAVGIAALAVLLTRLRVRVAELEAARTRAVVAKLPPSEWDW